VLASPHKYTTRYPVREPLPGPGDAFLQIGMLTVTDSSRQSETSFRAARAVLKLRKSALPDDVVKGLAEEVVHRLVTRLHPYRNPEALPTQSEIDEFCDALLASDATLAPELVRRARRVGVPLETVYLGTLAGAARTLGERWDRDEVSFLTLTVAAGRMFAIMRELRFEISSARTAQPLDRTALFATVPGETHTLGITMAADLFRDHGWRIDLRTGLDHDGLLAAIEDKPYAIIGLSAGHPNMLGDLIRLIIALRITHPAAHILVSGQIVQQVPHLNAVIHADSVIGNAMDAMKVLEDFSDHA
jgi:MerR family transcriptional regulator, light-induced transcriptional regulator